MSMLVLSKVIYGYPVYQALLTTAGTNIEYLSVGVSFPLEYDVYSGPISADCTLSLNSFLFWFNCVFADDSLLFYLN